MRRQSVVCHEQPLAHFGAAMQCRKTDRNSILLSVRGMSLKYNRTLRAVGQVRIYAYIYIYLALNSDGLWCWLPAEKTSRTVGLKTSTYYTYANRARGKGFSRFEDLRNSMWQLIASRARALCTYYSPHKVLPLSLNSGD